MSLCLAEVVGLLWVTTNLAPGSPAEHSLMSVCFAEVLGLLWVTISLTAADVFAFLAEVAGLLWVKALLCSSIHGPVGRLGHVVCCCEGLEAIAVIVALHQTVEAWVVNPCPPFSVNFKLKARQ